MQWKVLNLASIFIKMDSILLAHLQLLKRSAMGVQQASPNQTPQSGTQSVKKFAEIQPPFNHASV